MEKLGEVIIKVGIKGRSPIKKECLLSGIGRIRGGKTPARKLRPYFYQVLYAQNIVFDVRKKRTKLPELGGWGGQSHKKQKLSGQQDFSRKNFPDKARKSRHWRIRDNCA